jgi:hypothetical protein
MYLPIAPRPDLAQLEEIGDAFLDTSNAPGARADAAHLSIVVLTVAGRFAPRKYQAPPAIAMSATIPAASGTNIERCFGTVDLGFTSAGLPTSSA